MWTRPVSRVQIIKKTEDGDLAVSVTEVVVSEDGSMSDSAWWLRRCVPTAPPINAEPDEARFSPSR